MEEHTTPRSENFADLNQNSATLLGGKVDIVDPNENDVLSNGVHVEDKNENRPLLSELDQQTPDSIADMTTSSSQDTGFGSASVSEVSSPVENRGVVGRLQNQNADSETEGETYDSVVLGDETDNDENTLNEEASDENVVHTARAKDAHNDVEAGSEDNEKTENENVVHTARTKDANNDIEADNEDNDKTENEHVVHTAHTEDVNNDVDADNEDDEKTDNENVVHTAHTEDVNNDVEAENEKSVDSETQNTSVENEVNGSGEQGIVAKASDVTKVEHVNHASDLVENLVEDIIEDHITETEQKLVDSGNVGSTDYKESEKENVDDTASDQVIDRNVDDATNTNLEGGKNHEVNDFDSSEHVEYSKVHYKNTDDVVEVVNESVKGPANDEVVEEGDYNKLREPEIEKPASNDTESENIEKVINDTKHENIGKVTNDTKNENIEKVTNDTKNENIEQAANDIMHDIEAEKELGCEAKIEDAADERDQHTLEDALAEFEKAAIDEDQKVDDVIADAAEDEKAGNEEKGMVDILGNGLLKKKVLIAGKGVHTRPNNGDIVTVTVDGQLPDGTHVDTEEIKFNLNEGDVLLAFDLAVALMEEGEKCELFTSEKYAYGSLGREPDIPKGTSITYTLELVKIEQPPAVTEMNYDQRLRIGEAKRERGNYLFGRTDYSGAINSYSRAVKLLDNPELNEGIDESCCSVLTESWVKCYNNLAACQLKIEAVDSAIKSCEKVLSVQKDNVKALFRLAKAYGVKGEIDEAIGYLRRAIKLEPESKLMQQEMLNLSRRKSKETATEKELYQRMLGVRSGEKSLAEENRKGNSNKLVKWTLVVGGVAAVLISVGLTWYRAS